MQVNSLPSEPKMWTIMVYVYQFQHLQAYGRLVNHQEITLIQR